MRALFCWLFPVKINVFSFCSRVCSGSAAPTTRKRLQSVAMTIQRWLAGLLHLCSYLSVNALKALPLAQRRSIVIAAASLGLPMPSRAIDDLPGQVTKMDAFQLKASYNGLFDALQQWRVEIAAVQLGNEPSSVVAVAGLSDAELKHFSELDKSAAEAVKSFEQRKNEMLQSLFLARGAARYERDPSVALTYIEKARGAAEGAMGDLGTIATIAGVKLTRRPPTKAAAASAEAALTFTPRVAPAPPDNKLTF